MSNPLKPSNVRIDVAALLKPKPKLTPDLLETLRSTFLKVQAAKEEKIAAGELDDQGNPIGTEYAFGRPKRIRTPEKVGADGRRRRKTVIKAGMLFGDLSILRRGPKIKASRPNIAERWRCRCVCGNELIVPKYYLVRKPNPKTHCGCKNATIKSLNQREYRIWMMIHQRTENDKHPSYKTYADKGIKIFPEWHKTKKDGFAKFLEYVNTPPIGPCPSQWHSLDRIRNNEGYYPGNLRWATAQEQRANQGDRIGGFTSAQIADMGLTEDEFVEKILAGEIFE